METLSSNLILIFGFFIFLIFALLVVLIISRTDKINRLEATLTNLKRSFNELDDQAKLIVKTDLELNRAQEELDRRLSSLDTLQKTSRLITKTLDENEIFQHLHQLMEELGFEKALLLLYDKESKLVDRVKYGFSDEEMAVVMDNFAKDKKLTKNLEEGQTSSSANLPHQSRELLVSIFGAEHFVLTPIITQNGLIGCIFVGNRSHALAMTEGDEELISILADQIGQSLENARLFEQVYKSTQTLEAKIQDRTKQLASVLKEVQEISKKKSEFISAVSHELRTPLTSIKGYASLLMTGKLGDVPDTVKDRLKKINAHSDNLVNLINNLLDIARIESGRTEMNIAKSNIAQIVANVDDLLAPQIKEKNLNFEIQLPENIPEMMLDSTQIERVFINLISNAIKFTPPEGKITLKMKLKEDSLKIEVSDTGIGIKEDDLNKLFDEFYRVENNINQSVKGTGLGLSLVKKIVEAHQGKIWITSKENQGTTFHIVLPLERTEAST